MLTLGIVNAVGFNPHPCGGGVRTPWQPDQTRHPRFNPHPCGGGVRTRPSNGWSTRVAFQSAPLRGRCPDVATSAMELAYTVSIRTPAGAVSGRTLWKLLINHRNYPMFPNVSQKFALSDTRKPSKVLTTLPFASSFKELDCFQMRFARKQPFHGEDNAPKTCPCRPFRAHDPA